MSTSKPVVVYGASGYTGRLVCEYLREYGLPFVAAGRDAARVQQVMDSLPGIETADYEVAAVEHSVDGLTELFTGASVVCNMVGPFADLGPECVQASLNAGCHYTDTNGEQNWMLAAQREFADKFEESGLLLAPGIAQMYTTGEIAANYALETPGIDSLDILVLWKGAPTTASTETIFTNLLSDAYYLENNEYVEWPPPQGYEVAMPGQHVTALTLPWGGTSHPVWFKDDHRVRNAKVLGGVFNRELMEGVVQISQMVHEQIKPLPLEEAKAALAEQAAAMKAEMPPRENQLYNLSVDSVYGMGPLAQVHVVIKGTCNYKQTGLLQAYAAHRLVNGKPDVVGFGSGCQAFGHRELFGTLKSFGLVVDPVIS